MSVDSSVPKALPDDLECGAKGAYFFVNEPDWVARHTETIVIDNELSGRRRLTVDIDLPREVDAAVATIDDEALFCIPVALLRKTPPTSHIDLRDEEGRALPLLTRDENADISLTALEHALAGHNPDGLYDQFDEDINEVLLGDDEVYAAVKSVIVSAKAIDDTRPDAPRLRRVLEDLSTNSYVWVLLRGRPGQRRVIKLSYAFTRRHSPPLVRKHEEVMAEFHDGDSTVQLPVRVARRVKWRQTARRWLRPVATSLGWSAYQARIDFPAFRGTHSYHLQIEAPEGLVLRGIACDVDPGDGDIATACDGLRAHLYLWGADVRESAPIEIAFRAVRPGFLNLSLAATLVAAAGLWVAQSRVHDVDSSTERQVAAAVLLVLPALLALLVVRQSEHPLVTHLLAGVRALVMLAAFCSVAAAAALAGIVLPTWQDPSEAWIWCASIATAALLGVGLAWLLSWSRVSSVVMQAALSGPETYLARLVVLGILTAALAVCVRLDVARVASAEPIVALCGALIAAAAVSAAATPAAFPRFAMRALFVVVAVASLATATIALLDVGSARDLIHVMVAVGTAVTVFAGGVVTLFGRRRD